MANILIIDDEVLLARSLAKSLVHRGHECQIAGTAEEGLSLLQTAPPDVVLLDLQLPGMSGQEALSEILEFDAGIVVIITTAYGTVTSAVDAMRVGAADFLRKPLDIEEINLTIERAMANARMRDTLSYYRRRDNELAGTDHMLGESAVMQAVTVQLSRLAGLDLARASDCPPLLITGETGTGKDLAARWLHNRSKFASQPFIEVNCPLLPRGLEEAELFGYERGAFTDAKKSKRGLFQAASGGTIFLNEVGDLPLETQVKLLQVIETKTLRHIGGLRDIPVDVRIIAATNRDLKAMVDKGEFRNDLFHRLHHFYVEMPPLHTRGTDILLLAEHFLSQTARKYGLAKKTFAVDAKNALKSYHWPGNLRELSHVIERAVVLSQEPAIGTAELGLNHPNTQSSGATIPPDALPPKGKILSLDEIEKRAIQNALTASGDNVSEAARMLEIGREALRYRIQKHGLET